MLTRKGRRVVNVCPICGGRLVDDGDHQDCLCCDYQAPTGSHDLIPRISRERESREHRDLKKKACRWLETRGFQTEMECGCGLSRAVEIRKGRSQEYVIVDAVGFKRGRHVVAVECGSEKKGKLEVLTRGFAEVWLWRHGAREPRRIEKTKRFRGLRMDVGVEAPNAAFRFL